MVVIFGALIDDRLSVMYVFDQLCVGVFVGLIITNAFLSMMHWPFLIDALTVMLGLK